MIYNKRLLYIRELKKLSQTDVANAVGMKQQQYARYEKGINLLPVTNLIKLCKFFDISSDYILGLSDEMKPCEKKN